MSGWSTGKPYLFRAIAHSTSPGMQVRHTSGRTAWIVQDVATPTLPASAQHRSPSQRMPDCLALTRCSGIKASVASSSIENRGQFAE